MKKLRLLVTKRCNRDCVGCCNKDWDLDNLEVCDSFKDYDEILITGGEPTLFPTLLYPLIHKIKDTSNAKVYVYTANSESEHILNHILEVSDGITVTIHDKLDVFQFKYLNHYIKYDKNKSYRLNIFKGMDVKDINKMWKVKDNIEWIKGMSLPEHEVLMKLPELWK